MIVDQAAKNAVTAEVTQLDVTGHTDTVGSDAYNMRLSRRRAESAAAELDKERHPLWRDYDFRQGQTRSFGPDRRCCEGAAESACPNRVFRRPDLIAIRSC
jgi:outer membrane protein OmpA-like peptidoglycan-associated protein